MTNDLPLPEYSERFSPRWPGDTGGYEADQMICYGRAYVAAAAMPERALLRIALDALVYHREQTRPIHQSDVAIDALRAALAAPSAPTAPPGYALVPIEPTQEMCRAGRIAEISATTHMTQAIVYRAMIAAAGETK